MSSFNYKYNNYGYDQEYHFSTYTKEHAKKHIDIKEYTPNHELKAQSFLQQDNTPNIPIQRITCLCEEPSDNSDGGGESWT